MRYLGRLHGHGVVTMAGRDIGRASYDIDGFAVHPQGITGSGEIRLQPTDLAHVFGHRDVHLRTDDGRLLDLRFSDKELRGAGDVAHVDVGGGLPTSTGRWRDRSRPTPAGSARVASPPTLSADRLPPARAEIADDPRAEPDLDPRQPPGS